MVKTPRTRHAKSRRTPVTIDLTASEVQPTEEAPKQPDEIDVSVSDRPVEQLRDEAGAETVDAAPQNEAADAAVEPDSSREPDEIDASVSAKPIEQLREQVQPEDGSDAPVEDPVDERIESETASTGAYRPSPHYAFDDSERETPAAAPQPNPPRRGGFSSIAAGLTGAVAAILGTILLQWGGVLPSPTGGSPAAALEPVQTELAALKDELATLKSAPPGDTEGLATSIDQLKSELAAVQSAVQSGGAGDASAVAALDGKLKEIEARLAQPQAGAAPQVEEKLTGLEGQVTAATDAVTKSDARVAALEQSVVGLTSKVDQQASQPKVALAIATAALKSAVNRGGPFSAELETLAAIAPGAAELGALRGFAENGIATETDIASSMAAAADAMVAATAPVDENAGFMQRLVDSAKSVVKTRRVGDVAGDEPDARIARMEVAVKAGQYEQAIAEYEALPDAAKAAGAAFADRIKARLQVTKLVDQLVAGAMKAA